MAVPDSGASDSVHPSLRGRKTWNKAMMLLGFCLTHRRDRRVIGSRSLPTLEKVRNQRDHGND
jgi:hypothetical protein